MRLRDTRRVVKRGGYVLHYVLRVFWAVVRNVRRPWSLAALLAESDRAIDITFRSGILVSAPGRRSAWRAVFENLISDEYRFKSLDVSVAAGDAIIDVGAHVGSAAIALSRRFPSARILCFEPHPETFKWLQRNLSFNGVSGIAFNEAIGGVDASLALDARSVADPSARVVEPNRVEPAGTVIVRSRALASVLRENAPVRVVKMDCEGAEWEILSSALQADWVDVSAILLEYHPGVDWASLVARCEALGFLLSWSRPHPWEPGLGTAGFVRRAEVRASAG